MLRYEITTVRESSVLSCFDGFLFSDIGADVMKDPFCHNACFPFFPVFTFLNSGMSAGIIFVYVHPVSHVFTAAAHSQLVASGIKMVTKPMVDIQTTISDTTNETV